MLSDNCFPKYFQVHVEVFIMVAGWFLIQCCLKVKHIQQTVHKFLLTEALKSGLENVLNIKVIFSINVELCT